MLCLMRESDRAAAPASATRACRRFSAVQRAPMASDTLRGRKAGFVLSTRQLTWVAARGEWARMNAGVKS